MSQTFPARSPAPSLDAFSGPTREWFRSSFDAPTPAQTGAWAAISAGQHALVVAPTGSGKTLAAFLWAVDSLVSRSETVRPERRCRVLYVSPLKALATDVQRNLRAPLVGIERAAARLGLTVPEVTVAVRSGDTSAQQRRQLATKPPDILITTPESLFLMLTSAARSALAGVETVIIDEVHAVAGTKRGAHLALSLERLDALLDRPAQRIGLSATVEPVDEVARFLAGGRPVSVVRPPSEKRWDLKVVVPVEDLGALGEPTGDLSGPAAGEPRRTSIWPHVEERIVDLIAEHRSTLVFANSRRLAERLTARLNEVWADRLAAAAEATEAEATDSPGTDSQGTDGEGAHGERAGAGPAGRDGGHTGPPGEPPRLGPAEAISASGLSHGAAPYLARAHHGSVSKEQRTLIEEDLKAGRLPAVVATSSLELGIDMGAVDLVVQVESPPSVASGLQRVGRAGHEVGAVSHGVLFPKYRGDLVQTAVVVERMRAGLIESLHIPANPLDVLAQQIVAMCALDDWRVDDVEALVRHTASFATLTRPVLEAVLDMLAGRYPSEEFAELRPRLVWDRVQGVLSGRRGAQRLAVTSGGTIPDRGLYGVFLAGAEGTARRVGELDEEMVYESRVGDVFMLGTTSWRIEDITHDRVIVTPAPGQVARLPFWKGEGLGRPVELGRAVGALTRELAALPSRAATARLAAAGLDEFAAGNLLTYLQEQREAIGAVPSDVGIVVERFRDELGDWQVVIHSPFGRPVHAPWALCIAERLRERFGVDVQALHGDDGIVLRLPDVELGAEDDPATGSVTTRGGGSGDLAGRTLDAELAELLVLDPDEVADMVTATIGGSALFAARFRECAARALLLPRRHPGRRQPLWQQRQRSAQLLEVASKYPSFPIVLEAVRECVQDVYDVPALVDLMRAVERREISVSLVTTPAPSPFARALLFGYVAQFLYEGDAPLAERRAAALAMDPTLLADLLGQGGALALRDLLDPDSLARTEAELQHLAPSRWCRDAEDVADLLRVLGPLSAIGVAARSAREPADAEPDLRRAMGWLDELTAARRVIAVRIADELRYAAVEDAGRLRDALGTAVPPGVPHAFLDGGPDPLGDLVVRYARTHGPFTVDEVASWWGLGRAVAAAQTARLVADGRLVSGALRPLTDADHVGAELCDPHVLRTLRRRSLAALRAEVEPVEPIQLARFLSAWQGVGASSRGPDALLRVVEQLSGVPLPASAWESLVLPARLPAYSPGDLDELMTSGEVIWSGAGELAGGDGWVALHAADLAPLTLPLHADQADGPLAEAVLAALSGGAGHFVGSLVTAARTAVPEATEREVAELLWSLVWAGAVTNDTWAPLRARLGVSRVTHRSRAAAPRARPGRRGLLLPRSGGAATRPTTADPALAGRWSLVPTPEPDPTTRALATAELLLDRYGVVTRGSAVAEDVPGGFAAVYRVLSAAEEAGRVRRGYFVEGLGASQFGTTGAVDRLRAGAPAPRASHGRPGVSAAPPAYVLAACDPANPYGAALPWPARPTASAEPDGSRGHQPARKAGAVVVLVGGALALYVERGGRSTLSYTDDDSTLAAAAHALAEAVRRGALGRITVERTDGDQLLGSGHPLGRALKDAGFIATSRGLRLRR